jgi:hypothetical protein
MQVEFGKIYQHIRDKDDYIIPVCFNDYGRYMVVDIYLNNFELGQLCTTSIYGEYEAENNYIPAAFDAIKPYFHQIIIGILTHHLNGFKLI